MKPLIVWPLLWLSLLLTVLETFAYCLEMVSGLRMLEVVYCTQIGLRSTLIAWAYMFIFLQPGMIFSFVPGFLDGVAYWLSTKNKIQDINKYHRIKWLMKPLADCEKCCTGQIALWWYLTSTPLSQFNFFNMAYTISIAVLFMEYATWTYRNRQETP